MLANPLPTLRFLDINSTKSDRLEGRVKEIVMGEGVGATHYNWDWDVEGYIYGRILPYITATFGFEATAPNTYVDHPNGWRLDNRSVDFWNPAGRGFPIDFTVGEAIVNYVMNIDGNNPPFTSWYIWQGVIWDNFYGYRWYWDENDLHYDHVHFTFEPICPPWCI
jgi:hypothetical protein